jgi:hypothetical protein
MTPQGQRVRTRGSARPRNLAVGCLAVLVVLAACGLLGRLLQEAGPEADAPPTEQVAP